MMALEVVNCQAQVHDLILICHTDLILICQTFLMVLSTDMLHPILETSEEADYQIL